ncbi:MAG: hypothetical protein ACLP1X_11895 [Polyangiaceae bacterium]
MKHACNWVGALLVALGTWVSAGGLAHAQTCAPNEALCQGGACCSLPSLCCPSAIGGCCGEATPYCCGGGICAVTPSYCPGASSSAADSGCAGYDIPCGAACIPAGADCCDPNHYCSPTTTCASPSTCTNGTGSPPTKANVIPTPPPSSPLDDPADATARSCATAYGEPAPRIAMYALAGVFALARWRRQTASGRTRP